jgi:anti-anti-sigma factor
MAVEVRQRDSVVIFALSGRIIGSAVRDLREAIDHQLAQISGPPRLLFDFGEVTLLDSSGLGTLMGMHVAIARKGGRIGVVNVGANIKNLIIRSRLISTFEHFASETDAIEALSHGDSSEGEDAKA